MTAPVDVLRQAPALVVVPVDTFDVRTVPGPALGLDRPARSPLRFGVLTVDAAPMPPGWWLDVTRTASGAYVGYGEVTGPDRVRRRLTGGPVDVTLSVRSRFYRPQPAPLAVRLHNLDPAAASTVVAPAVVELIPGVLYPFPARLFGFGLVRGLVTGPAGRPGVDGVTVSATAPASGGVPALNDGCRTDHGGQFVFAVPDTGRTARTVTLAVAGAPAVTAVLPPSGTATATTIVIP